MTSVRGLVTRRGLVPFPAYIPVTTFGGKYPLDELIRPYLPRLAHGLMISYHYARQAREEETTELPRFVYSGGFASLFERSRIADDSGLGVIEMPGEEGMDRVHPRDVLELQEQLAEVGFPLDFPIPPGTALPDAERRRALTLANARWAIANRRRRDLLLFGCAQGWDVASYADCSRQLAAMGFDGLAIGGLVPRARDRDFLSEVIRAVRSEAGDQPVHVFGLGHPELVRLAFDAGADSVDSSSYVKHAAEGVSWADPGAKLVDPSPTERLHLALRNLAIASRASLPLSVLARRPVEHSQRLPADRTPGSVGVRSSG